VTTVPVPRYGAGNLSPAGSLQAFVDSAVLSGHTYRGATWDPEGTVSTLPAIATVLFGILTGHWLKAARTPQLRTAGLLVGGAADVLIGQIMSIWLPINKYLWTSSYAVFTAGLAMIFFGVCYWLVDVKAIRWWTKPLVVFGMNAIAVFVLSGLLAKPMTIWKVTSASGEEVFVKNYLYDSFFAPLASPINASLLWALVYVLVWLGIMWLFYWRKIFLKI
jgi:predicted acyltransferase